jgi:hypothetical protein
MRRFELAPDRGRRGRGGHSVAGVIELVDLPTFPKRTLGSRCGLRLSR